MTELDADQCSM